MVRAASVAGAAEATLDAERAALQAQLDQTTAALQVSYQTGVDAAEARFRQAEARSSAAHCEDLRLVVAPQRFAFREHDAIRDAESSIDRQAWQLNEQQQQWQRRRLNSS